MLEIIAGWVAPIATMIAAIMTAANLGARVTGWGFVVFTAGSIAWSIVGITSGQQNLIISNGFLTLVNLIGVWRWLGRQSAYEDGGESATRASRCAAGPDLFTATGICGMAVADQNGKILGRAVEALIECQNGGLRYVVVATGGIGGVEEQLRAVRSCQMDFGSEQLALRMDEDAFEAILPLLDGKWPVDPPLATRGTS